MDDRTILEVDRILAIRLGHCHLTDPKKSDEQNKLRRIHTSRIFLDG